MDPNQDKMKSNLLPTKSILKDDKSVPPGMRKPVFISPTPSCRWLTITWPEIREEVSELIETVEVTLRDKTLPPHVHLSVIDKKRALETAIRRRTRQVDEIWWCFRTLEQIHDDILNDNLLSIGVRPVCRDSKSSPIVRFDRSPSVRFEMRDPSSSAQHVSLGPGASARHRENSMGCQGDILHPFEGRTRSCLEMLSRTLIQCGKDLDIYDEESQSVNRVAGIGLGIAVFIAVYTVAYYS